MPPHQPQRPTLTNPNPTKRRRFRFSLRALLIVVVLLSVVGVVAAFSRYCWAEVILMSSIDSRLTDHERAVLAMYRDPAKSNIGRATRLSVQYGIGAGFLVCAGIVTDNPWWAVAVYGVFVAWMTVRLLGMRRIAGVMPTIIEKYEDRIIELEAQLLDDRRDQP